MRIGLGNREPSAPGIKVLAPRSNGFVSAMRVHLLIGILRGEIGKREMREGARGNNIQDEGVIHESR
jgi:hypothetical protein